MRPLDLNRRAVFAGALGVLLLGTLVISLLPGPPSDNPVEYAQSHSSSGDRPMGSGGAVSVAADSATRFAAAYLRYQEGVLGPAERRSISLFSTPGFGGQLLRAPVRVPPDTLLARHWVARIAAIRAGLFEGRPALVAILVIVSSEGGHLLRATLVQRRSRWLVAGVGP